MSENNLGKAAHSLQIRRLNPNHAAAYRAIMLQAYESEPEAFTATVAERESLPLTWWENRISEQPDASALVFGAFSDAQLAGVAGLRYERRPRTLHKAKLFGMFVLPAFRGYGIARRLVQAVLSQARSTPGMQVVQLTVTASNAAAVQLYSVCGFVPFGTEPFANKVDERFVSVLHMWCPVGEMAAAAL